MARWNGVGHVVFGMGLVLFLPFIVSLFGCDVRMKVASTGLCIGALLLTGFGSLQFSAWVAAFAFAGLSIRADQGKGRGACQTEGATDTLNFARGEP